MAGLTRRWLLTRLATVAGATSLAMINNVPRPGETVTPGVSAATGEIAVSGTGTAAIQAAVDAAPDGGVVRIPADTTHHVSTVTFPNRDLTVVMYGATVRTAASKYAFMQPNPVRLTVCGGRFSGLGNGILYRRLPSDVQSYDFAAIGVDFFLAAGSTGINLTGVRESTITNCFFDSCTGVYLNQAVNSHVVGCQFRNCTRGIHADGSATGSAYDAGLMVSDATMLGCGYGVHAVGWDWVSIVNAMIDYCDRPVNLTNIDTASIVSSYLSNRNFRDGTDAAPVVELATSETLAGGFTQHVRLGNNQIICRSTATPDLSIGIRLGGVSWCSIVNNSVHFWQQYGVQVSSPSTYLQILGNIFNPISGATARASVYGTNGDDSTWIISDNVLGAPIVNTVAPILRGNIG